MRRVCQAQAYPAAFQNRRFNHSPVDALIDLVVGCRLRRQIPVCWLDLRPVIHLRIAVIPQRLPARRGYVWGLRVDTDVVQNPPDSRVPSVMNAIRRICPPHIGHSNGNTSKILAISTAHR